MEIKVPNLGPVNEAIRAMDIKPQHFFVTGLVLSLIAAFDHGSSTGLGIAAAAAFLSAAWGQSIVMSAFLNRPPVPPSDPPAACGLAPTTTPPPQAQSKPSPGPIPPPAPIDLEPPPTDNTAK